MTGTLLHVGDEFNAVVTTVAPFGLLVESDSGVPGLVRGRIATVGTTVRVRVIEFDAAASRFSAAIAE